MPFDTLRKLARSLMRDRRGNVAVLSALAMPVLIGSLGIGAEVASWEGGKRGLQNGGDSAAIAAATNATDTGYADEARAVATRYGFTQGVDGVTVTPLNNQPCPTAADGNTCYRVTISKTQPLFLAQVVGFRGDTVVGGAPAKIIEASALAIQGLGPRQYCVLALATSGKPSALLGNGSPSINLSGCNVMSNTDAVCNGHDLLADVGDAHGHNDGCGKVKNSNVPIVEDPYAKLADNIPDEPCPPLGQSGKMYPTAPVKNKGQPLDNPRQILNGMISAPVVTMCGDVQVGAPVFITGDTVLVIKDGSLDLNDQTLQTMPGAHLTIIFTGTDMNRTHTPVGNGTLDIEAPKTGPWKGMALYQDPALTGGVDISEAGNQPTWDITGMAYFPHASVTFSGAVSKSSSGAKCFAMVVDNLRINGTGSILDNGECAKAGLILPEGKAPTRGELVS